MFKYRRMKFLQKLLRIQRHRCLYFNKVKFQTPHILALPDTSYCRRTSAGSVPIRRGGEDIQKHAKQFLKEAGGVLAQ